MTSKQRVRAALNHEKPDRVPIHYSANPDINRRLMEHFGVSDREGLLRALETDIRNIKLPYKGPVLHPDIPGRIVDNEWGIVMRKVENESGYYIDYCDFPLEHADEDEVAAYPMPNPDDYDYDSLEGQIETFGTFGLSFGGPGLGDIINSNGMIRSMEQVMVDLITDDPAGLLLIKRRAEIMLRRTERALDKIGRKIDFLYLGEDLGTQRGPIISREIYNRNLKPYHKQFVDLAKAYNLHVMVHTCGSSSWVYPDFIEMGVTAVDTLQPEALNMSPEYLKSHFGDKLAFQGAISTTGKLAFGTPDEVEEDVRRTLEILMPGGGYILAPAHMIQDNTPTENVLRMYEAAKKYGVYSK